MSLYIVDASVAAMWFTGEKLSDAAFRVVRGDNQLHAPDFFLLEMNNIFCKWVRRGVMGISDASDLRVALRRYAIQAYPFSSLLDLACTIANWTRRSLYDCLYVALAVALNRQMVTADRKLHDALAGGPFSGFMCWVEDVA